MNGAQDSKIAVIIPNWNGQPFLHLPLDSLRGQAFRDFETILVDNGSRDGSTDYVRKHYPEVRVVALARNTGFPGAVNSGVRESRSEFIALLNNDAAADENWLLRLHRATIEKPQYDFFACKVLLYNLRTHLDSAGLYLYPYGGGGSRGNLRADGVEFADEKEIFGPAGSAVLYRRSTLDKVGLMDETLFAYYEDLDLAFRAQLQGHRCLYIPDAIVYHVGSLTNANKSTDETYDEREFGSEDYSNRYHRVSSFIMYHSTRNYLTNLLQNMPSSLLWKYSWAITAYELNLPFFALRHRQLPSYVRGRLDFLRDLPTVLQKRRQVQSKKTVSDGYIESMLEPFGPRELLASLARKVRRLRS